MDTNALVLCFFVIALIASLIVFRKEPHVKKYWAYVLILIPLLILIIIKKLAVKPAPNTPYAPNPLATKVQDLKDNLAEAQLVSAVEISAAKTKNEAVIEKLEAVKKIDDPSERRKQLASLIG